MDTIHEDAKRCLDSQSYDEVTTPSLLASSGLRDFESTLDSAMEDGRDDALDISSLSKTSFEFSKSFEEFSRNSKFYMYGIILQRK